MNLTRWFAGKHKPGRRGIYQRDYGICFGYAKWNGSHWLWGSDRQADAAIETTASNRQTLPWRGLLDKPFDSEEVQR